jgi:hypothetical protein
VYAAVQQRTSHPGQCYHWCVLYEAHCCSSDAGGELDLHGAEGTGNSVGGNVTTTVADGTDLAIVEWMLYMSADQFCLRACDNANATYSAAAMCGQKLDVSLPIHDSAMAD